MALNKQKIQLNIQSGLDTKVDEKSGQAIYFNELENAIFTKTGSLNKRFGYEKELDEVLEQPQLITSFKDQLLTQADDKLYTIYDGVKKQVGDLFTFSLNKKQIGTGLYANVDSWVYNSTRATVSVISNPGSTYKVTFTDENTGVLLASNIFSGILAGVIGFSGSFLVFAHDGTPPYALKMYRFNLDDLNTLFPQTYNINSAATSEVSLNILQNTLYLAYTNSSGLFAHTIQNDFNISSALMMWSSANANYTVNSPSITSEGGNIRLAYSDNLGNIYTKLVNSNLVLEIHPQVLIQNFPEAAGLSGGFWCYACETSSSSSVLYFSMYPGLNQQKTVKYYVNSGGVVTNPNNYVFKNRIVCFKPTKLDDKVYVGFQEIPRRMLPPDPSNYGWNAIASIYILDSDDRLICSVGLDSVTTGPTYTANKMQSINGVLQGSFLQLSDIDTDLGSINENMTATCFYMEASKPQTVEAQNSLYFSGAMLQSYDGNSISEAGFLQTPSAMSITLGANSSTINGYWQFVQVYCWRDVYGQVHRSNPSIPTGTNVTSGQVIQLWYSPLQYTNKKAGEFYIEFYAKQPGSLTFNRLNETVINTIYDGWDNSGPYLPVTIGTGYNLTSKELLYTDSGELENIALPSTRSIVSWKQRVMALSSDGRFLHFSKLAEGGYPVQFNDGYTVALEDFGGPATALAILDDSLIIFKEDAIYIFSGDGPNNLGEQSDYRLPILISSDCGCIDRDSVVRASEGIYFKSKKGIYVLRRGLALTYIGDKVERYNSSTINSAVLMAETNQVRFTTEDGYALVYDYYHNTWSIFTNIYAVHSIVYKNSYYYLSSYGLIGKESTNYTDFGSFIPMKIVTNWYQFAGLQGYQRFYKLFLIGKYLSKHYLRVKLGYDFKQNFDHETLIDVESAIESSLYGESEYGEGPYASLQTYQWRVNPKVQKCQAFRISIEDTEYDKGASFSLSAFGLEIGIKQGFNKLGAGKINAAT